MDHIADRAVSLMAVRNARMLYTTTCERKKVVIETENHSVTAVIKVNLLKVGCFEQAGVVRGRHVDAAKP